MEKVSKYALILLACIVACILFSITGYNFARRLYNSQAQNEGQNQQSAEDGVEAMARRSGASSSGDRIKPTTRMRYEYHYLNDGTVEVAEEAPPYFLVDMNRERLGEMFTGWEITSFTSDQVVMRKNMAARSSQRYTVGVMNGYVAVFYRDSSNLKELINMPVHALPEIEQVRLREGIRVDSDEALMKMLQDYGS